MHALIVWFNAFVFNVIDFSNSNIISTDWEINNFFNFLKVSSAFLVQSNDIFFLVRFVRDKTILKYFSKIFYRSSQILDRIKLLSYFLTLIN